MRAICFAVRLQVEHHTFQGAADKGEKRGLAKPNEALVEVTAAACYKQQQTQQQRQHQTQQPEQQRQRQRAVEIDNSTGKPLGQGLA